LSAHLKKEMVEVDGGALYCVGAGSGDPLVLVHGGLTDHSSWLQVAPQLAASLRVTAYDRRGHSRSRGVADGPRSRHEDDLAAVIEALDLGPAHLAGTSYGASIALGLGARRPELVRSLAVHEPPLFGNGVARGDARLRPEVQEMVARLQAVTNQMRAGDTEGGVVRFIEEVTLGPGTWERLPEEVRRTMVANASTFLETMDDPQWADLDIRVLSQRSVPVLLTDGDRSPAALRVIVTELAGLLGEGAGCERHTFTGAGHVPQITHPQRYAETVGSFLASSSRDRVRGSA
jgi:pimeloyl-ACP methyl ester carboxylesterase